MENAEQKQKSVIFNENNLQKTVEELVEELRQSIIIVEEFQSPSQQYLFDKLNKVISLYEKIESNRNAFNHVEIPFEIFRVIDQSKNPDLYVKETLQNCLAANEKTKGKIESIIDFKETLESHIASSFPDEYKEYQSLKKPTE
ncbi:putative mediator complex subunit 10 [Tieghemostelium lacteum]|uniref:Mediator of RNA polymerase II transcription subunit 10 n=1 Tax=Tieghemostelium lacteum TaxID=361077 RepID=A0A151Z7R7_TIELA|nr:putative mediator complex subunit 10 [Tieghemostelium lacteum]|eukprot:KYQ90009.1 putative mediator complex subunit 10 [Tieghemostelium lacteum]